jgi:hypothetical protein
MKINILLFESLLHKENLITTERQAIIDCFKNFGFVKIYKQEEFDNFISVSTNNSINILYILTGGTEEAFLKKASTLCRPFILLSDSYSNSLAATLEICTYLSNNKIEHYHINAPINIANSFEDKIKKTLELLDFNATNYMDCIKGSKIGLIGNASPWLIASNINKEKIATENNIQFIDIPISKIVEEYSKLHSQINDEDRNQLVKQFSHYLIKGRDITDLTDAIILYKTIKKICINEHLDAITIKCFELLTPCNTTACLALALLNDEGIISGCEGDIPAMISMLAVYKKYNKKSFMVNPSSIDDEQFTIDLSHCTIPLSLTTSYKFDFTLKVEKE